MTVSKDLTPTQELFMEVLAAHYRLGEGYWTFEHRQSTYTAAQYLATKGLIVLLNGITETTFRAYLTPAGKDRQLSKTYKPAVRRAAPPVMSNLDAGFDWKQGFTAGWLAREELG